MTKVFCDRCGKEDGLCFTVQIPCHIAEGSHGAYLDREGNAVSGRMVDFDLCAKCANHVNKVTYAAIKAKEASNG